ncbi:MAG: hypothetical protein DK304_001411 [Chloroflexi bacterium]|nr:MAG: hypothetical protein DK304_001411 [Chloroflexota bacterium]
MTGGYPSAILAFEGATFRSFFCREEKGLKLRPTPVVYVVQENPRVDVVSAAQWGDLIPLANPYDQVHLNPGRIVSSFRRKLRNYNDSDWLLPLGDPAMIGIAFAVAADMNEGRVNLLKWDRLERHYYPVKISVRGGIEELTT